MSSMASRDRIQYMLCKKLTGTTEMAQQVEVLATKPDDQSSIPRTHIKEQTDSHKLASDLHSHTLAYTQTHAHIHTYTHMHVHTICLHMCTQMYVHIHAYTYILTCTHPCIEMHTIIHTHTCSHTQIRCKKPSQTSCYAWKWARSELGLLLLQVEEAAAADLALLLA